MTNEEKLEINNKISVHGFDTFFREKYHKLDYDPDDIRYQVLKERYIEAANNLQNYIEIETNANISDSTRVSNNC